MQYLIKVMQYFLYCHDQFDFHSVLYNYSVVSFLHLCIHMSLHFSNCKMEDSRKSNTSQENLYQHDHELLDIPAITLSIKMTLSVMN